MTAGAARIQVIQTDECCTTLNLPTFDDPPARKGCPGLTCLGQPLPPISVVEAGTGLKFLVPLSGIGARNVYVFAAPRSILIEIRITKHVTHPGPIQQERQHQRITRELKLRKSIEEGSTSIRMVGDNLEIACVTTADPDDRLWSELLRMDTRASLGCVTMAD